MVMEWDQSPAAGDVVGAEASLQACIAVGQQRLIEQQRQLVALQNQHKAALIGELRTRIRQSPYDYVGVLEALLPSGWFLSRRKGKLYERRREPRWRVKGHPSCTYTQGRFSRELQEHMRAVGLDPAARADRHFFVANHMERI